MKTEIRVMRIAEYILETVGRRVVPGSGRGKVVMKLDVEGREMSIIGRQHLVLSFCTMQSLIVRLFIFKRV